MTPKRHYWLSNVLILVGLFCAASSESLWGGAAYAVMLVENLRLMATSVPKWRRYETED